MAVRPPKNFVVEISLDNNLQFQYSELFTKMDASSLTVINGDQIAWILDPAITDRTLQIDFGTVNPFRLFRSVTLRGNGQVGAGPVNFPSAFPGNRQLKYTVSLGNGLQDDPDVVPVEANLLALAPNTLGLTTNFKIEWTDNTYQAVQLDPYELSLKAIAGRATVTWQWSVNSDNDPTPPFALSFQNPPPGWPASTDSTDPHPGITLSLPPGPCTKFTVTTTSGDGVNSIQTSGYLTVTA